MDNYLPFVAPLLQARYREARRAYIAEASKHHPNIAPLPVRRSRKRKPIPGVIDAADLEQG